MRWPLDLEGRVNPIHQRAAARRRRPDAGLNLIGQRSRFARIPIKAGKGPGIEEGVPDSDLEKKERRGYRKLRT